MYAAQNKTLRILGIRGLPAAHGGFETFAEHLALYLVKRGWRVIVYCQSENVSRFQEDSWNGIERVHVPSSSGGSLASVVFDYRATIHAARYSDLCLTLGYNTALFCFWLKIKRVRNVINMDGIEWARAKWGPLAKAWFWLNERFGCWLGDRLVADHPEIANHLSTRVDSERIVTIPYGGESIEDADPAVLTDFALRPYGYMTVIARPEPENSILEIVKGFSKRPRGVNLVVLGAYDSADKYHVRVKAAASAEVLFIGAIYDKKIVQSLRFFSLAYVHGHQVGGTNPSLVEAMGAGNAVIAHDNRFNRWVAGSSASYFNNDIDFDALLTSCLSQDDALRLNRDAIKARHAAHFTWDDILGQYEDLLTKEAARSKVTASVTV